MPALEGLHLGGASGLAARLDDRGDGVIHPHEADRPRRLAAAGELLLAGAERGEVGAGARAELEEHRLAGRQPHDAFHVVADALDEAGRGLRVLVGARRPRVTVAGLLVPSPVVGRAVDPVAVEQPDVEPDRRVERAVLVQAEGRQLVVEPLGVLVGGEVAVFLAPVGDRPGHAVDQLADRVLALTVRRAAVAAGDVPVEVLAGHHVGRQLAPAPGISQSTCWKIARPRSSLISAVRRSHSTSSNGLDPSRAEHPRDMHPGPRPRPSRAPALFVSSPSAAKTLDARSPTVAIARLRFTANAHHGRGRSLRPDPAVYRLLESRGVPLSRKIEPDFGYRSPGGKSCELRDPVVRPDGSRGGIGLPSAVGPRLLPCSEASSIDQSSLTHGRGSLANRPGFSPFKCGGCEGSAGEYEEHRRPPGHPPERPRKTSRRPTRHRAGAVMPTHHPTRHDNHPARIVPP